MGRSWYHRNPILDFSLSGSQPLGWSTGAITQVDFRTHVPSRGNITFLTSVSLQKRILLAIVIVCISISISTAFGEGQSSLITKQRKIGSTYFHRNYHMQPNRWHNVKIGNWICKKYFIKHRPFIFALIEYGRPYSCLKSPLAGITMLLSLRIVLKSLSLMFKDVLPTQMNCICDQTNLCDPEQQSPVDFLRFKTSPFLWLSV